MTPLQDLSRTACRILVCAVLASSGMAAAADAVESALANGMRLIVKPDRRAPVVVSMVWYKVGSVDEVTGATGIAHVLEHMMFQGTRAVPMGEFSRRIAAAGGRDNAFTSKDYTGYFQMLHKSQLELSLSLEADRMVNLVLSPDQFAKEVKVVMEERRLRTDDRPRAQVYEQLTAAAYVAHPYRNPIIGWMKDLEQLRVEQARAFYDQWYAPNNAILVVVGDVEPKEVFVLADKYFGGIPRKELPQRVSSEDPVQLGPKRIVVKAQAELPYLLMGYHVPPLRDPERDVDSYALEMLASVLSGGDAARLPRRLVRGERLANSASAGYDGIGRGPGMFYLSGVPNPGRTVAEIEAALRRELKEIADQGVSQDELKRIKAQVVARHVYERDSMFFQAREIGAMEAAGLPHTAIDLYVKKLQQVTAEQVQQVAQKFFGEDTLTVAELVPQPLDAKRARAEPPPGVRHE
jgi:zinc protease